MLMYEVLYNVNLLWAADARFSVVEWGRGWWRHGLCKAWLTKLLFRLRQSSAAIRPCHSWYRRTTSTILRPATWIFRPSTTHYSTSTSTIRWYSNLMILSCYLWHLIFKCELILSYRYLFIRKHLSLPRPIFYIYHISTYTFYIS